MAKKKESVEKEVKMEESKHRFSLADYGEQVKTIIELTEKINQAVESMVECNVKKSYQTSVKNLMKKNSIVSKGQGKNLISTEDKELLRKIRAGEVEITPVQR